MTVRTIRMLGMSALCALLVQPAFADSTWRRSADGVWKKHISANQATVRMALLGKRTYFALTVSCGGKDGRTETYRWTAGDQTAKSTDPCEAGGPTLRPETVIDLFLPFPADYDPLRKERVQPELII